MNIVKLDKRHTGHTIFTHYVTPRGTDEFLSMRNWCFDTLGIGIERDLIVSRNYHNRAQFTWAWHWNKNENRIYFTEQTYTMFALKWV